MLEAARAKQREGADVVIGWVETHGRAETAALAEGLERLPARELEYRDVKLQEFDLDAALARKPALLLLDELAHTNAPGARHAKRWQDVEELRDAGINVYTTLNVQHLESLNDLVNRVTGVVVARDHPRPCPRRGRRGRVHRPAPRGAAEAPRRGKGLPAGAGRRGGRAASSAAATSWPCASWRCAGRPSTWTPTSRTTGATTRSSRPGRWRNAFSSACARTPRATGWCARPGAWPPG